MKTVKYNQLSAQDKLVQSVLQSLKKFDYDLKSERIKKGIAARELNKK